MKGQKNKKQGFLERVRAAFTKNEMLLPSVFGYRIEMHGTKKQSRALVSGVRRILVCTGACVCLEVREENLCFFGEQLECLCYESGIAEISGTIKGFSIGEEAGA